MEPREKVLTVYKFSESGGRAMQIGAAMFFTEYSMRPADLARAVEERGFESVWAPEHSHIPLSRKSPFPSGGELPRQYYDVMDPFVEPVVGRCRRPSTIKIGTGVCLIIQRDTIQTAKLVASLDQVSCGRFLFGVGGGWNREEMEDHGAVFATRFKRMREQIEAMRVIWTETKPEYHGEIVDFPAMSTWPKPLQKPHPPVIVGGVFPHAARRAIRYGNGWIPHSRRPQYEDVTDYLPQFREMAVEAGRDLAEVPVTVWGVPPDLDRLKRYRKQGVSRGVVQLARSRLIKHCRSSIAGLN